MAEPVRFRVVDTRLGILNVMARMPFRFGIGVDRCDRPGNPGGDLRDGRRSAVTRICRGLSVLQMVRQTTRKGTGRGHPGPDRVHRCRCGGLPGRRIRIPHSTIGAISIQHLKKPAWRATIIGWAAISACRWSSGQPSTPSAGCCGQGFDPLVRGSVLGIDEPTVFGRSSAGVGCPPRSPAQPRQRLTLRHTIGLADPLSAGRSRGSHQ